MGLGFSLCSYLQYTEIKVRLNQELESKSQTIKFAALFTLFWIFIAIYCYRSRIPKTIPEMEYTIIDMTKDAFDPKK
jgi:hypothetical protein